MIWNVLFGTLFVLCLAVMRGLAVLGERVGDGGLWLIAPYGMFMTIGIVCAGYGLHKLATWGM